MHAHAVLVALALILAPLGAKAADLMAWCEGGFNPEEDAAVAEVIAASEQDTGKRVDRIHRAATAVGKVHGVGLGGGADRRQRRELAT